MQRFCLTLKLRPDPALIAQYIRHHEAVWPEIQQSIRDAGVVDMQIYELDGTLFMILDAVDSFTFEHKARLDAANPKVQEWERLMEQFQDVAPGAEGGKWKPMRKVFSLQAAD